MPGISDQKVVFAYTGATKQLYDAPTLDYRFRVQLPEFVPGSGWAMADTRVRIVAPDGTVTVYDPVANSANAAFWDVVGGYLWIKPANVVNWSADLSAWRIHLLYRPTPAQNEDPASMSAFSPVGNAAQHDRDVRLAQVALEVSRLALVMPPEDEDFTGREVALADRLLPKAADRALKALAWDANNKLTAVYFDAALAALNLAGKAATTYVDAQDAAEVTARNAAIAAAVSAAISAEVASRNAAILSAVPTGVSFPYMGPTVPAGFLKEDGSALSKTTYATLWAALSSAKGAFTVTIATPAVFTLNGHGLETGQQAFLNTTGALPTGLTADTNYWVIRIDANTFNLATSQANAFAGTKIATSGTQSGVHSLTFAPWGISGASNFLLPPAASATKRGAGTPTKFTANTILTLGQIIDDAFMGHWHGDGNATRAGSSYAADSNTTPTVNAAAAGISNGVAAKSYSSDGNGTPRSGPETTGKALGVYWIIKY